MSPTIQKVSSGVYGHIYLVKDKSKTFIIKEGKTNDIKYEEYIHRTLHGAVICYTLHKAIDKKCAQHIPKPLDIDVTTYGFNTSPKFYAYAMENIKGITLREYLKSNPSQSAINAVLQQIRNVFLCLWKVGFIHGDAHTENIMVVMKNKNPVIKLIDFGFTTRVVPLQNSSKEAVAKWFAREWKKVLRELGINKGNPNYVYFNPSKVNFFAEKNKERIRNFVHTSPGNNKAKQSWHGRVGMKNKNAKSSVKLNSNVRKV